MSQNRLPLLLGLLALVLGIRWSDLLGRTKTVQAVSEPVERSAGRPVMAHAQVASMQSGPAWPVRTASHEKNAGNAFMTRAEAAAQAIKTASGSCATVTACLCGTAPSSGTTPALASDWYLGRWQ
jgi:hypothetical protein